MQARGWACFSHHRENLDDNATRRWLGVPHARLAAQQMLVTAYNDTTGEISISYGVACDATGHHVVYGPLTEVSSYGYSGQACGLGATGAATFNPGSGSRFWLIVGEGSGKEGSYGRASSGVERPEATGLPGGCDYPQDLNAACE